MTDQTKDIIDPFLYKGLQALSDLSFPKKCSTCGKRYATLEDFIAQTQPLRKSTGLKEDLDDDDKVIVELFRNCICGSTLMDEFNNRRNLSSAGLKRRKKFAEIIERLEKAGFTADIARLELLKIMKGQGSSLLNVKKSSEEIKI